MKKAFSYLHTGIYIVKNVYTFKESEKSFNFKYQCLLGTSTSRYQYWNPWHSNNNRSVVLKYHTHVRKQHLISYSILYLFFHPRTAQRKRSLRECDFCLSPSTAGWKERSVWTLRMNFEWWLLALEIMVDNYFKADRIIGNVLSIYLQELSPNRYCQVFFISAAWAKYKLKFYTNFTFEMNMYSYGSQCISFIHQEY